MTEVSEAVARKARPSPWTPFRHRAFAVLWIATVISNIGTWMHEVGAGWLMTELSSSPLLVASVQAATTLPVFLFALIAGAVSDIVDRRRMLIIVNFLTATAAACLAALVTFGLVTPLTLILFTFLLGAGAAFMAPAWQAIVPSLVPRSDISAAIALNSAGINISRAIGPALAGFLIVALGLWAPFALNALSFAGIIAALVWWNPPPAAERSLPPERITSAIVAGWRYVLNSHPVRATLARAAAFFLFASAFWAMLPLVAREALSSGPTLYGFILGAVGAGAVLGALLLPTIKSRLGPDLTVALGTLGTAAVLAVLATTSNQFLAIGISVLAGMSWIAVLSSLHVLVQTALPDWVRARGLSFFLTVFFGSMAIGSLVWGQVASLAGLSASLMAAAVGAVLMIAVTWGAKLGQGEDLDLAPSMHWPPPILTNNASPDRGPIMIQVTYTISPQDRETFAGLMRELARARRRGGAYGWTLMQKADASDVFVETWFEASWLQHLRHHEHVTGEDRKLQEQIAALQRARYASEPMVGHYIDAFASEAANPAKERS